mmetsp:Transcript_12295/g.44837  ORF Transcript_12295/g.44837 Transcript_12295/m.44837 type:complete len:218 (+) Transcript_12295:1805-2458(+)
MYSCASTTQLTHKSETCIHLYRMIISCCEGTACMQWNASPMYNTTMTIHGGPYCTAYWGTGSQSQPALISAQHGAIFPCTLTRVPPLVGFVPNEEEPDVQDYQVHVQSQASIGVLPQKGASECAVVHKGREGRLYPVASLASRGEGHEQPLSVLANTCPYLSSANFVAPVASIAGHVAVASLSRLYAHQVHGLLGHGSFNCSLLMQKLIGQLVQACF